MSSSAPKLNPSIAAAPLYVAGTSIESVRGSTGLAEIVKLASNESPLGPSPRAVEALLDALSSLHRYPPTAPTALHKALADHYGGDLVSDHFVVGGGASEIIDMLTRGFARDGDQVIISRPTFPLYEISAQRWGAEIVNVNLNSRFSLDVPAILKAITPRTRILHICTPNNPTGTIVTPDQAEELIRAVPQEVLIVFDESYRLFVERDSDLVDTLDLITHRPNVISVRSFSKTYGLAGLRVGYAIAPPRIAIYLRRMHQPFFCGSPVMQAAIAALGDDAFVREVRRIVLEERAWLADQLEAFDLEVIPSQANFVCVRSVYPGELIYERMMALGVIVRPLEIFSLPGWFRITVGRHEENMRCVDALRHVLYQLAAEDIVPAS